MYLALISPVAMAMNFEYKLNCAEEFYKLKDFKQIHFELILVLHFFPIVFGSAAMTSYLTSWNKT